MIDLWIDEKKQKIKDDKNWAEIKVKRDEYAGEEYIDLVIGSKNKQKEHTHMGINLDQSIRFTEFRDVTRSVGLKVESKEKGILQNDVVEIDPNVKSYRTTTLQFKIEGSTGEVIITKFEFD